MPHPYHPPELMQAATFQQAGISNPILIKQRKRRGKFQLARSRNEIYDRQLALDSETEIQGQINDASQYLQQPQDLFLWRHWTYF